MDIVIELEFIQIIPSHPPKPSMRNLIPSHLLLFYERSQRGLNRAHLSDILSWFYFFEGVNDQQKCLNEITPFTYVILVSTIWHMFPLWGEGILHGHVNVLFLIWTWCIKLF